MVGWWNSLEKSAILLDKIVDSMINIIRLFLCPLLTEGGSEGVMRD